MFPVDQSTFGGPSAPPAERGDCWLACLASILNVELRQLPRVCELDDFGQWLTTINADVLVPRGFVYLEVEECPEQDSVLEGVLAHVGHHVISGPSPRGKWQHSVVGYRGSVVFDPHPSRAGLGVGNRSYGLLLKAGV